MQLQVLGPVRVWRGGVELPVGAAGPRTLLALLALAAGQPLRRSELAEALWGDRPPAAAANVVQTYLKLLRQLAEPDRPPRTPSRLLPTIGGAYALRLPADDLDLTRFRQLVAAADQAEHHADRRRAGAALRDTLDLWQGLPAADIPGLADHPRMVALADRLTQDPAAVEEIIDRCAGLPLALAIVAARAETQPATGLDTTVLELREGLDGFATGDSATEIRTVFSWSYQALKPEAARLFRVLALHPASELAAPAAASLAGLAPRQVRPLLTTLVRTHLVGEPRPGRYACHDLIRAYALELGADTDDETERQGARRRLLDHYLHTAYAAAMLLEPARDPIRISPPATGAAVTQLADRAEALAWFGAERRALATAVAMAAGHGFDRYVCDLPWALADFLDLSGHWHELVELQAIAREAGARLADEPTQIRALNSLAVASARLNRFDDAGEHLRRAAQLSDRRDDPGLQARIQLSLGALAATRHRHRDALTHYRAALARYRAIGDQARQARTLNSLSWSHAALGDHCEALRGGEQARDLAQRSGDRHTQGAAWDTLGFVHDQQGNHAEAAACYRLALTIHRDNGDLRLVAATLTHLGDNRHAAGDPAAAHRAWQEAWQILAGLDHPDAGPLHAKLAANPPPAQAGPDRQRF